MTTKIEQSVDVPQPVRTVYNQWTQFEEFPRFMEGVESVKQIDDTHLHWVAEIGGQRREWDAEITEQKPDQRIAWKSTSGPTNAGVVSFHPLNDNETRVMLQLEHEPSGPVEKVGEWLGVIERRAKADLQRFADFIAKRGTESGAWRGEVDR
jgi:uncharacterized membrane protein